MTGRPALPLVIDTDPGVDDALALCMAGASPEVDVRAVTVVGGNTPLTQGTENALRILPFAWGDRGPFPAVHAGLDAAVLAAADPHGDDGLGGRAADFPVSGRAEREGAADALVRLARRWPGELTLLTIGPLSNLAAALGSEPELPSLLREVVIMGGAFREPGNVTSVAEYNVYADAPAAATVAASGLKQRWVPLDATHRCILLQERLDRFPESPRTRFLRAILQGYLRCDSVELGRPGCYVHDPVALAALLWPDAFHWEARRVRVEVEGRHTRGATIVDLRPPSRREPDPQHVLVCLGVRDAEELVERIARRLERSPVTGF